MDACDLHHQEHAVSRQSGVTQNFPKAEQSPVPIFERPASKLVVLLLRFLFSPLGSLCGPLIKTRARAADKRCAGGSPAGVPLSLTPRVLIVDD